jgi:predicted Zn-ribbon and HTH transcriptional regulator
MAWKVRPMSEREIAELEAWRKHEAELEAAMRSDLARMGPMMPVAPAWCAHCNGYGSSLKEESERCTHCDGTGLAVTK